MDFFLQTNKSFSSNKTHRHKDKHYPSLNRTRSKNHKRKGKNMKKRYSKKAGTITSGFGLGGLNFSKTTGNKMYDWKSGQWLNQTCYNILGFKYCNNPIKQ